MAYRIERDSAPRESFGEYRYLIYKDGDLVAKYWHDYRGDDHGIEFLDGKNDFWPVGGVGSFMEGGGSAPLRLSAKAVAYLDEKLS